MPKGLALKEKMKETNLEETWCFPGFPVSAVYYSPTLDKHRILLPSQLFFYCALAVTVPFFPTSRLLVGFVKGNISPITIILTQMRPAVLAFFLQGLSKSLRKEFLHWADKQKCYWNKQYLHMKTSKAARP